MRKLSLALLSLATLFSVMQTSSAHAVAPEIELQYGLSLLGEPLTATEADTTIYSNGKAMTGIVAGSSYSYILRIQNSKGWVTAASGVMPATYTERKLSIPASFMPNRGTSYAARAYFALPNVNPASITSLPEQKRLELRARIKRQGIPYNVPARYRGRMVFGKSGNEMRWDPCKPIPYRVSVNRAGWSPKGALATTKASVARIAKLTGFTFVYKGTVTSATANRSIGSDFFGITVNFRPDKAKNLGSAKYHAIATPSTALEILQVHVIMNERTLAKNERKRVLLHELGHAMGLGHSKNSKDLMYSRLYLQKDFSTPDLLGLKHLVGAKNDCFS